MSDLYIWSCIVALTLVTIFTRSFFLSIGSRLKFSPKLRSLVQYAPMGALIAIVLPEILFEKDFLSNSYQLLFRPAQFYASLATIFCFYLTRSMLWSVTLGMLMLTLIHSQL